MKCEAAREAISAGLDGEDRVVEQRLVDEHLLGCSSCRAYAARAADLVELTARHTVARPAPEVSTRFVERVVAENDRRRLRLHVRLSLVFVAAAQLVLAVPALVYGADDGAPVHVAHEMGSWDVALAVAFLFAAWRPLRAIGLLPFVATLAFGLCLTAIVDVVSGRAVAVVETSHLLEVIGTALLWLLARPVTRHARARREPLRIA